MQLCAERQTVGALAEESELRQELSFTLALGFYGADLAWLVSSYNDPSCS